MEKKTSLFSVVDLPGILNQLNFRYLLDELTGLALAFEFCEAQDTMKNVI